MHTPTAKDGHNREHIVNEKPLDLTKPMQTRDGRKVRLLASDLAGKFPLVVAVARPDGSELLAVRCKNGGVYSGRQNEGDIINVPAKVIRYLNIYSDRAGLLHPSAIEADDVAEIGRIARIRIEFNEGQFDD